MDDARPLGLIKRFRIVFARIYSLNRCYRQFNRHVIPHRCCVKVWPA